jgi:hypothetical protein
MKKSYKSGVLGAASVKSASAVESTQWTKYHTPGAHGFAAEDANALHDKLCGKSVDKVGLNNELNGADRIVNGTPVQTKYYQSAYDSVNAAFDLENIYRYPGQKLEVPKDQYEEAVKHLEAKIRDGRVPGVTDPAEAKSMLVQGNCTYKQAVRIAKAGNLDSIWFDVKNQAVACGFAAGLSFVISYAFGRFSGQDCKAALKSSVQQAIKAGALTITAGVATQQFLRTQTGRNAAAAATKVASKAVDSVCRTKLGAELVRKMMSAMLGKTVTQSAARNACIKMVRSNFFTGAAMTLVSTVPDVVKACCGKRSWKQVGKNAVVNTAGLGGGTAGYWAGAAVGTAICPGIGTVIGGVIGGLGGGMLTSWGSKKALDCIIEDDSVRCTNCLEETIVSLCEAHDTTKEKLETILKRMKSQNVLSEKFFCRMYKAGGKGRNYPAMAAFVRVEIEPYFA